MPPPPPDADETLSALNRLRLSQWSDAMTEREASAVVLIGMGLWGAPGEVRVLAPENFNVQEVLMLLHKAVQAVELNGLDP